MVIQAAEGLLLWALEWYVSRALLCFKKEDLTSGQVGVAFVEKLLNYDNGETGGKSYIVTIVGDEPHIAYNRVGLVRTTTLCCISIN